MNADGGSIQATGNYASATTQAGVIDACDRTKIELTGADRASFLHNFCTNDIRRLPVHTGCEAFITTVQGKILAHVFVFAAPDSLVVETVPGQAEQIIAHLDRYLIREQVAFHDRTEEWGELLLCGPAARSVLEACGAKELPEQDLGHTRVDLAGHEAWLRRADALTSVGGYLIAAPRERIDEIARALIAAGAAPCGRDTAEILRVEAGFPRYGVDITDKNLPQEVARDSRTISFVKGCYLGQETVARIDALGHVNRTLCGLRFSAIELPPAGAELTKDGHVVAQVTSAAFSPRLGCAIALAYVRRGSNTAGMELESPVGSATVVDLPFALA